MESIFVSTNEIEKQKAIAGELRGICAGKKAAVKTYGCQQNEADSERIAGTLMLCGYEIIDDETEADLVIVNTCAVREHAELKILSSTGRLKNKKEKNRDMLIGICGCMAQEKHRVEQILKSYTFIDFIFGTDMHHRLPEILQTVISTRKRQVFVNEKKHNEFGVISEDMPVLRQSDYKAWVSIMYGCNNFCSYCIVPYVRGRERSRSYHEIMKEVRGLVADGYKDITLLGQNVNSYSGEKDFASARGHRENRRGFLGPLYDQPPEGRFQRADRHYRRERKNRKAFSPAVPGGKRPDFVADEPPLHQTAVYRESA